MKSSLMSVVALAALATTGCSQLPTALSSVVPANVRTRLMSEAQVSKILCLWEPAEGKSVNGAPSRGFAGQILFFTPGQKLPIPVHGVVTIYEFDNVGTAEEQARPIHKFKFDDVAWNMHMTDGDVGPAYNVFIPYTRKHHYGARCALRLKYESPNGDVTYSEMAGIVLPGPPHPQGFVPKPGSDPLAVSEFVKNQLDRAIDRVDSAPSASPDAGASGSGVRTMSLRNERPDAMRRILDR